MTDNEFKEKTQSIRGMLYRTAQLYMNSRSLALDVLDETVYRALCSHRKVKSPEHFDSWMIQILMRECYRKLRRLKKVCPMEELSETAVQEFDALPLKEAVRSLPGDLKDILILTYFSGLSLAETAKALNIPQETATLRQRKALQLLNLGTDDEEAGRKQEYLTLMEELEKDLPDLQESVDKALARRSFRHRFLYLPAAAAAAAAGCIILFAAAVNLSFKAAYACSQVPGLRKLAAVANVTTPLWDMLDNDYVQKVNLTQTQNDITAHISHLIMDDKQLMVFYTISSTRYIHLADRSRILSADGDDDLWYGAYNFFPMKPGDPYDESGLLCHTFDLRDHTVHEGLTLRMDVSGYENQEAYTKRNNLARFDFLLEYDSRSVAEKKVFPIDRTLEQDGQKMTIRQIEVYPTMLTVRLEDDPSNTAWLQDLDCDIVTDQEACADHRFSWTEGSDPIYRVFDGFWFYGAKHINLDITGVEWKSKDLNKSRVNLQTGETEGLPPGVSFKLAGKWGKDEGWIIEFLWTPPFSGPDQEIQTEPFDWNFFDMYGDYYVVDKSTSELWSRAPHEKTNDTYLLRYYLPYYPYDEIWFSPDKFDTWTTNEEIIITIQ